MASGKHIRVLVVNDSRTVRASLRAALESEPDLEVVGEAPDGAIAVELVLERRPAVVLMDVVMPRLDGYAATRAIMEACPTPIVLVSSVVDPKDIRVAMEALRSGALAVTSGLPAPSDPQHAYRKAALAQLVRSMAGVRLRRVAAPPPSPLRAAEGSPAEIAAVGLAASTGGPSAIADVVAALPRGAFPPLLVVQHLSQGFASGFARWLADATGHPTEIAVHGAPAEPGRMYVAPEDRHLGLDASRRLVVSDEPPVGLFRPSANFLFRSLARSLGSGALGVVLTGMGSDGAEGALELRRAGGRVAAQDEGSSVVFGMPRAAFDRGGVDDVLTLGDIGLWICERSGVRCAPS